MLFTIIPLAEGLRESYFPPFVVKKKQKPFDANYCKNPQ